MVYLYIIWIIRYQQKSDLLTISSYKKILLPSGFRLVLLSVVLCCQLACIDLHTAIAI